MTAFRTRLYVLDDSSNVVYAGNSSNGVFVWGAQLELEEYFNNAQQNFNDFRYIRTQGAIQSQLDARYRLSQQTDAAIATERLNYYIASTIGNFDPYVVVSESITLSSPEIIMDLMVLSGSEDLQSSTGNSSDLMVF